MFAKNVFVSRLESIICKTINVRACASRASPAYTDSRIYRKIYTLYIYFALDIYGNRGYAWECRLKSRF